MIMEVLKSLSSDAENPNVDDELIATVPPSLSVTLNIVGGKAAASTKDSRDHKGNSNGKVENKMYFHPRPLTDEATAERPTMNNENGTFVQREILVDMFRRLIDNNTVLGFPPELHRQHYEMTPILQVLMNDFSTKKKKSQQNLLRSSDNGGGGVISVALVPPGLGKTTAAKCLLQLNKASTQGIAICRQRRDDCSGAGSDDPFVKSMLRLLLLNGKHPPNGWLSCLMDAFEINSRGNRKINILSDGCSETTSIHSDCYYDEDDDIISETSNITTMTEQDQTEERSNHHDMTRIQNDRLSYLILDGFVSDPPNPTDHSFLMTLQAFLRNSRTYIHTIILTPSEKYANYLLSSKSLNYDFSYHDHGAGRGKMIRPLNGHGGGILPFPVLKQEQLEATERGIYCVSRTMKTETSYFWEDMHWSMSTLKAVVKRLPALATIYDSKLDVKNSAVININTKNTNICNLIDLEIERCVCRIRKNQEGGKVEYSQTHVQQQKMIPPEQTLTRVNPNVVFEMLKERLCSMGIIEDHRRDRRIPSAETADFKYLSLCNITGDPSRTNDSDCVLL